MSTMTVYQETGRAGIGTPVSFLRDQPVASSPASPPRTTRIARHRVRAAGRAIVRWYRGGQLGGDQTLRAGRWAGGRC